MYSRRFYISNVKTNMMSAERIVSFIQKIYTPKSVVDVGSSGGVLLNEFMKYGISDILGIDGPWISDKDILIPLKNFNRVDLKKGFSIERKFDLAICLEVLEHLDMETGKLVLRNLALLSDVVLFSAAIPGQGGTHHINEQWPVYWVEEFSKYGFKYIDLRQYLWNDENILPWYKQNMMMYIKREQYDYFLTKLNKLERLDPLSYIHPDMTYVGLLGLNEDLFFSRLLFGIGKFYTRFVRSYAIIKKSQKARNK